MVLKQQRKLNEELAKSKTEAKITQRKKQNLYFQLFSQSRLKYPYTENNSNFNVKIKCHFYLIYSSIEQVASGADVRHEEERERERRNMDGTEEIE